MAGAAAVAGVVAFPSNQAVAHAAAHTIEDVLSGRLTTPPIPGNQLAAQLVAAHADFRATCYSQLSRSLPRLLAQATAGREAALFGEASTASTRLAQAYNIAMQLLIKLHDNEMAWAIAGHAVQAARGGDDPTVLAHAQHLTATVMRRTHQHEDAQRLMLDTARELHAHTGLTDAASCALFAKIVAGASYTAAMRHDRDTAWTLLAEAEDAARKVGTADGAPFNLLELAAYRISVARVLGDYGAAVNYARMVDPTRIVSPERRARYWEDTALALHGRGRPQAAFQALQAAERDTPQEVRCRPWAQQLTQELLITGRHIVPEIRVFASRVGAL